MAKTYSVRFDILGSLDPSLLNALKAAQDNFRALGKLNGKTLANAQRLAAAQSKLNNLQDYKDAMRTAQAQAQARAQELLTANRLLLSHKNALNRLADMKKAYGELAKAQTRLKNNAQVQRAGVDIARAELKNAKATGDVSQIKAAQDALARQQDSARRAAQAVKDINAALKLGRAELKAQKFSVKELGSNFNQSSERAAQLQQQLAQQFAQVNQLRINAPANLGQAETHLRAEIQQTTAAINQQLAALEHRNQVFNNFSQRQQDLFHAYSNFQNAIQTAQTIMNLFAEAADNAMTFEKSLSRLKSLTQMRNLRAGNFIQAEKEMAELAATIEHLGATTEYTSNEIAGAANFYAMSGWTSEQIAAMLAPTTDLASIARIPIDRVADMISDDMTAFGIKAGEQYRLAGGKLVDGAKIFGDAVAYATTQSNMDFSIFHEAWKYNAPTAKAMNLSLGEAIAQNMMLANAGIKGSMSGTSLRQFWVRLSAPPKAAAKSLEEMGFAANDATQQIMNTEAAMAEANVTMSSGLFEKISALRNYYREGLAAGRDMTGWLKGLTGQTALSGIQALFDDDVLDRALQAAQEIDSGWIEGWAPQTAQVMRDNTQTAIDYLTSALDALQRGAGSALLPALRGAAEFFTPLVSAAAEFVAQNPAIVQACAAIATALATATVSIAGFSLAMAGVRFAQAGWATAALLFGDLASKIPLAAASFSSLAPAILNAARAAMTFAFTPIGAALAAIAIAALYAFDNWSRIAPAFEQLANTFSGILIPAIDNFKNAFSTLLESVHLDGLFEGFGNLADTIGGTLVGAIITAAGVIGTALSTVIAFVADVNTLLTDVSSNIINIFQAITSGDLSGIADAFKNAFSTIGEDLYSIGENFLGNISSGLQGTAAALDTFVHPDFDTTSAQADVDALGLSAQNAALSMDGLENVSQSAQTTAEGMTQAGETAVNAGMQFQMAGDTALQAVGGFQSMAEGAGAVAGALAAKAGEISSIVISVPQVNYVPMDIGIPSGVAHNAAGGIYPKGEFLTTFAEKSPEAAIPLDKSARAISLWQQAGQRLGIQPLSIPTFQTNQTPITIIVNVNGNAEEETIRRGVEQALPKVRSFAEELAAFQHEQFRRAFI